MKHVLIVNPVCGKQDVSSRVIPAFETAAEGLDIAVEKTKSQGHAAQLALQYCKVGDMVRFYVCGGDGTLNEVLQGCAGFDNAEIASIPCGSGNDFVRNFGECDEFRSFDEAIGGKTIKIDLPKVNGGVCAAIASVGIDANVAYRIPFFRRVPFCGGQTAYNLSIILNIMLPLGRKIRIEADDEIIKGEFLLAAICNGSYYGGGYSAAPCADLNDGMADFILVKKISRFRISSVLARYKKGEHIINGKVADDLADIISYRKVKKIKITPLDDKPIVVNVDGECAPKQGIDVEYTGIKANFVLPCAVYERYMKNAEINV